MKTLFSIAALALTASAALSQTPATGPEAKSDGDFNPNEMVCRRIQESGSRLNAARVCMTRQQWIDYQRQQRADTEQSQNRRVAPR
jgi:invasion protein IalB